MIATAGADDATVVGATLRGEERALPGCDPEPKRVRTGPAARGPAEAMMMGASVRLHDMAAKLWRL